MIRVTRTLISRNGHRFKQRDLLCEELAHAVRRDSAILDGEIVCFDDNGRPDIHKLLFRRDWPFFYAFDTLELDDNDVRRLPLVHRKRLLNPCIDDVGGGFTNSLSSGDTQCVAATASRQCFEPWEQTGV